jgi:hypothetical protein
MESWPLRLSLASSTLPVYPKVGFLCFPFIKVEARAQALLAALLEAEVLMGLPGVGPRVAAAVLALLPPHLWGRAKAAAAYAGLIPEGEELALPEGASPPAKAAFHGGLGGGAARPGDGGLLRSPALAGEAQRAGPGGRGPQASLWGPYPE